MKRRSVPFRHPMISSGTAMNLVRFCREKSKLVLTLATQFYSIYEFIDVHISCRSNSCRSNSVTEYGNFYAMRQIFCLPFKIFFFLSIEFCYRIRQFLCKVWQSIERFASTLLLRCSTPSQNLSLWNTRMAKILRYPFGLEGMMVISHSIWCT
jgi:hypothetical protein